MVAGESNIQLQQNLNVLLCTHFCYSVNYQSDDGARVKTSQEQKNINSKAVGNTKPDMSYTLTNTSKTGTTAPYQQLTLTTMERKGDYEIMGEGVDGRGGLRGQPGHVTLDDQIYDTCT